MLMEIILGKLLIYPIQMSSITLTTFSKSQYSLIIRPKTRLDFIRPKTRAQNTIGISIVGCSATVCGGVQTFTHHKWVSLHFFHL